MQAWVLYFSYWCSVITLHNYGVLTWCCLVGDHECFWRSISLHIEARLQPWRWRHYVFLNRWLVNTYHTHFVADHIGSKDNVSAVCSRGTRFKPWPEQSLCWFFVTVVPPSQHVDHITWIRSAFSPYQHNFLSKKSFLFTILTICFGFLVKTFSV